jgi:Response regulator containing a CheY-like receiver domain and an HD-GYP domain
MTALERFGIYETSIDKEGRVSPGAGSFWAYLDIEPPGAAVDPAEILDELAGREADIRRIASTGQGEIAIPGIVRGGAYFDLLVLPTMGAQGGATLVARECTESMRAQQAILQQRNEIEILQRDLERRNAQLREFMEMVRQANHDLETKVRERTVELRRSRLSVIAKLARVAEYKDKDTGGHIYRIGRSSVLVGRAYGLGEAECEELFHASLLHDVGKVGIPDAILRKPGPLTEEERATMQTHTLIGSELLEGDSSRLFAKAREVARFHHEKWDGSGYPEARRGEAIPLAARICSIVDVFDALLSVRPYKEAWSAQRALDLLRRESGVSFDPEVVRAFFEVAGDIAKLRESSTEDELEMLPEQY